MARLGLHAPPKGVRDLTTGNLARQTLQLSLPNMADMALTSVAVLINAYWMGQVGRGALGAVAVGTSLRVVLISPMMGLSGGGMAMVARFIGAREGRAADRVVMQCILLVLVIVTPLAIIGLTLGPTFLRWMGAEGQLAADAMAYLRIIFAGLFFMEMLPSMNGVIRGAGHPEYTLISNVVHALVIMALTPLLALGMGPFAALGVRGAGWAYVVGSAAGVLVQMAVLLSGRAGLRLHLADLRPDLPLMGRIMRIAIPMSVERLSPNLAAAWLMRLVTQQGVAVLTAYSLVNQISGFLLTPSMGLANAAGTLVGQNLGAQRTERAIESARLSSRWAILATAGLFGTLMISPARSLALFERAADVVAAGAAALPFFLVSGVGMAWASVMGRALAGAGDTVSPATVNVGARWVIQLPLCWLLSGPLGLGATGLWIGLATGNVLAGAALDRQFRCGRWQRIRI